MISARHAVGTPLKDGAKIARTLRDVIRDRIVAWAPILDVDPSTLQKHTP